MPISHRSSKVLLRALLSLSAIFALSLPLLLTACGGSASSTPGSAPTPTPGAAQGKWTWMGGSSTPSAPGVYGTQNTPSTTNVPGARGAAVSWTDNSGNFWLLGGTVINMSTGTTISLNDLWKFNPAANTWMWVGGSNTANAVGVYGTLGVPSTKNIPGARYGSVSWRDPSGNFWLFGGQGYDSIGANSYLNDLWEFNSAAKTWTWVNGSSTAVNATRSYGTQGIPNSINIPGVRIYSASWTDNSGNLWLFGGTGADLTGTIGQLNDLWGFNPQIKEWTWMSGSNTVPSQFGGQPGVYGALGTPAASNVPGGRSGSVTWTDGSGNLWLFGGTGFDSTGTQGQLNDLWEFNLTSKMWAWMSGSSTVGATGSGHSGVYGTEGTAAPSNIPGGRGGAMSWMDSSGNLWLLGGYGFDSTGREGNLNDLWKFNLTSKMWTWMSGSNAASTNVNSNSGVYGTLGVAAATNTPGARSGAVSWMDSSGNLWLFGGDGIGSTNMSGDLNDLWRYQP